LCRLVGVVFWFESFRLLVVARYQRWLFRRIGSNRKKAVVMSSEAKIPQGWLIGLAVLALAGMYIPGVCFVIFLAIVVYGKFETVFNHRNG
jgi:hypothetical protein